MSPHVCPVCSGRGTVSPDFYNNPFGSNGYGTSTVCPVPVTCRSCSGSGVLWEPATLQPVPIPVPLPAYPDPFPVPMIPEVPINPGDIPWQWPYGVEEVPLPYITGTGWRGPYTYTFTSTSQQFPTS